MKFTYTYKTSDGVRHSATIEASSKEEVFKSLRQIGIRPIKVLDPPASKYVERAAKIGVLFVLALLAVVSGYLLFFRREGEVKIDTSKYSKGEFQAYTNLIAKAEQLMTRKDQFFAKHDLSRARNYALLEEIQDISGIEQELKKARNHIGYTKTYLKNLFMGIYGLFPEDSEAAREDAKRVYGKFMDCLDADDMRILRDMRAMRFLHSHRGEWHEKDGNLVFDNEALEAEFAPLNQPLDSSVSRWSRDFLDEGQTNIDL